MKLRDIDPDALATAANDAALGRLWRIAQACGVTDPLVQRCQPSELWLAVHQLATYATEGVPPEQRAELIHDYQLSVAEAQDYVDADTRDALETVLLASLAREALARNEALSRRLLAVLASVHPDALSRLASAGDAPQGYRAGREVRTPVAEARDWLTARGVRGLG
jgi:hypothetical protein